MNISRKIESILYDAKYDLEMLCPRVIALATDAIVHLHSRGTWVHSGSPDVAYETLTEMVSDTLRVPICFRYRLERTTTGEAVVNYKVQDCHAHSIDQVLRAACENETLSIPEEFEEDYSAQELKLIRGAAESFLYTKIEKELGEAIPLSAYLTCALDDNKEAAEENPTVGMEAPGETAKTNMAEEPAAEPATRTAKSSAHKEPVADKKPQGMSEEDWTRRKKLISDLYKKSNFSTITDEATAKAVLESFESVWEDSQPLRVNPTIQGICNQIGKQASKLHSSAVRHQTGK